MYLRKCGNTTSVGFEPRTSFARLWRIKQWSTQSSLTGIWNPTSFACLWRIDPRYWNQFNFDHSHRNKSISTTHKETKSISMLTLKTSDLRPASNTKSTSTTNTKTKSIDHHTWNKVISARTVNFDSLHKKQVNFDPTQKRSQIRSPAQKRSQIRSPTQNLVNLDATTEIKSIRSPIQNRPKFRCPDTKTKLISIQTLKSSISDRYTKTKSISIQALKSCQVQPRYLANYEHPHENQVKFDPPHQNQVYFDLPPKSGQFQTHILVQVNF